MGATEIRAERPPVKIAVLDATGAQSAKAVLDRAAAAISQAGRGQLRAGIGTPFAGMGGFGASYHQARRALRHATFDKQFVFGPKDVIFDELLATSDETVDQLVPDAIRIALADPIVRETLGVFVESDLSVAHTARTLSLHPNSLRYRLRRIAEVTGRDPRKLADLLELIAASRVMNGRSPTRRVTVWAPSQLLEFSARERPRRPGR